MGLLDDAIREHLELKRRRGADPTEVEREESEALGPVRRGEIDLPDRGGVTAPEREPPAAAELDPELDPEPEPFGAEERAAVVYDDEPAAVVHEDEPEPEPEPEPAPAPEPATAHEHPPLDEHDVTPPHGDVLSQPTREFSAGELDEALGDAPPEGGEPAEAEAEDVLEETPEFLQETPEHDRLWFEQKPPKDFDF
jgi:hypothetical protein